MLKRSLLNTWLIEDLSVSTKYSQYYYETAPALTSAWSGL